MEVPGGAFSGDFCRSVQVHSLETLVEVFIGASLKDAFQSPTAVSPEPLKQIIWHLLELLYLEPPREVFNVASYSMFS